MSRSYSCAAIAALLLLPFTTTATAGDMTWQEANKQSADLIRSHGDATRAADLAYEAFELYGEQSQHYAAANQAQLLMNAVDARLSGLKPDAAAADVESGVEVLAKRAGPDVALAGLFRTLVERLAPLQEPAVANALAIAYYRLHEVFVRAHEVFTAAEMERIADEKLGIGEAKLVKGASAVYPPEALAKAQTGYVLAKLELAPDGSVAEVTVLQSAPGEVFVGPATDALKRYKFKPRSVNGKPAGQVVLQKLEFRLGGG